MKNMVIKEKLRKSTLLFSYFVDDPDRAMASTRFSYYFDPESKAFYIDSVHDDANSFHGSYRNPLRETTRDDVLTAARDHCSDQTERIERFLNENI